MMDRTDVTFISGADRCAAWFYPSPEPGAPIVVLGIGLGSTREMGLDRYARHFQAAGFAALAFDYRSFGASEGTPRQVIDVRRQLADWRSAIAAARTLPGVDPERVVIWGTSFGGGHVISLAVENLEGVVGAIAQCPFTDGIASAAVMHPLSSVGVAWKAVRDLIGARQRRPPIMIATSGPPRSTALMSSPDALGGFLALVPPQQRPTFTNEVAARIGLTIIGYRPGRSTRRISVPLFAGICLHDSVAPAKTALRQLRRAQNPVIQTYATGHFSIYLDPWFERAAADQTDFLRRVTAAPPR